MTRRKGSKLHILLLTGALLLAAGCGTAPEQESPPEEVSAETQAPIYSSNVPLEYLAMANQSSALRMNHDRVHLTSDHLLYGKTETWMDENVYYHREDDSRVLVHADDPRFAAVTEDEDGEPAVRYSTSVPEDVVFLSGDFQLLAFSEGETIEEEAEYEGAFHVITRRPAGTDAEFYSMLDAREDDIIREEYILDAATLALLENTTTLIKKDGSEEPIGTMTVSYTDPLPETGARLQDLLHDALGSSPSVTVTLREKGQEDILLRIRKDTLLQIDPGEGREVKKGKKAVRDALPMEEDTVFILSS